MASMVRPDYPAGTYYYVCVNTDGSTLTLEYGQSTATCQGAEAVQQWLESGQFVRTISLTTTGAVSSFPPQCIVDLIGAVAAAIAPEGDLVWVAADVAIHTWGVAYCLSGE